MLSTIHDTQSSLVPAHGSRTTQVPKPVCIQDYNKYMGGVDLSDQVLQPYNAMRKTRVWYKKISVHLTQIAMYNSFVLYRYTGSKDTFLQFQEKVIKSLIFAEQELEASASTPSTSSVVRIVPGQHFPAEIPVTGKTKKPPKKCRVCYKNGIRRDTKFHCETCPTNPGLCIKNCFKIYHTSLDF